MCVFVCVLMLFVCLTIITTFACLSPDVEIDSLAHSITKQPFFVCFLPFLPTRVRNEVMNEFQLS